MRLGQYNPARLAIYDRSAITRPVDYQGINIAPHAQTTRATYTVPTAKKGHIGLVGFTVVRSAAAAPVGLLNALLQIFTAQFVASKPCNILMLLNNVGDSQSFNLAPSLVLLTGDRFDILTNDASTGGTVTYYLGATISEYDA